MKVLAGARLALPATLTAVGAAAFTPLLPHRAFALTVAVAVITPAATVAVVRRHSLLAALAAWPALGLATSIAEGTAGNSVFADALDAPRTLLTSPLPPTATQGVLLWLFSVVWWAAYWSARATVSTAARALALLPPTLLLTAGTAASISAAAPATGLAVVFIALAALSLRPDQSAPGAADAARLAAAVAVGVVAAQVAVWVPGRARPLDPRTAVAHPIRTRQILSPLAQADRWAAEPPRPMFRVRSTAALPLRLTVLDNYDGEEWTSDAIYVASGPKLPTAAAVPVSHTEAAGIQIQDLAAAWLPAPDRPISVSGVPVATDPADGVLAAPAGRAETGLSYRVVSAVPQLSAAAAVRASPAAGPAYAPYIQVPASFPVAMARAAERITAPAGSPYQELLLLQNALRSGYRYDPRATPGQTVGHLAFFYLTARVGTADQFAATFALMARHLGFPARLAIGFTPGHEAGGGWSEVDSTDVVVWPEVALRGLGWVPFYPVPAPGRAGHGGVAEPSSRAAIDQQLSGWQRAARRPLAQASPARPRTGCAGNTRAGPAWAWIAAAAGLALLLCPLVLWSARWWLWRRRRSGPPEQQIAAAWQLSRRELARLGWRRGGGRPGPDPSDSPGVRDADSLASWDALAAMTAEESARYAQQRLGPLAGQAAAELAELVSTAVYSAQPARQGDAAAAWSAQRQLRAGVGVAIGRRGRLRRSFGFPWHRAGGRP